MNRRDFIDSAPMAAAFVAIGICWGSFAAQVPVLKAQIGASDSQFGLAMLVSSAGAVIAMWNAPRTDLLIGKHAMAILAAAMAVIFILPGVAGSVTQFAIFMTFAAMMTGTLDVIMNSKVSALETTSGRSLMGYSHGMFSMGYAISAFLTGLARAAGFAPWQIFLFVAFAIFTLLALLKRPSPATSHDIDVTSSKKPFRVGMAIIMGGGVMLIAFMAEQATEGWSALHLERTLGAGAVGGALGPTLLGATMAVGRFSGQLTLRFTSPIGVTFVAALVSASGAILAALAPNLSSAYSGFIILGLGVSVIVPMTFAIVGKLVPIEHRANAIARVTALGYTGFFIGPPMMGFLSEWKGLNASFLFIGFSLLLVPAIVLVLARRIR